MSDMLKQQVNVSSSDIQHNKSATTHRRRKRDMSR